MTCSYLQSTDSSVSAKSLQSGKWPGARDQPPEQELFSFDSGVFGATLQRFGMPTSPKLGEHHEIGDFVTRDRAQNENIVSRLLKVVETRFWAQNDRNSRVYISTYNNPKL